MNRVCLLFFLLLTIPISFFAQQTQIDSLQKRLPLLSGAPKVMALAQLSELTRSISAKRSADYAELAYKLSQKENDKSIQALAFKTLAQSYCSQQDFDLGLIFYNKAIDIYKKLGDEKNTSQLLNEVGKIKLRLGEYTTAISIFKQSLLLKKRTGTVNDIITANLNIGVAYKEMGLLDSAMIYYVSALKMSVKSDNKTTIATAYNHIAGIHKQKGNLKEALVIYQRALEIRKQIGNTHEIAQSFANIGTLYKEQSNYEQALEYHLKALELYEKNATETEVAVSYNNIGSVYWKLNNFQNALDYYFKALELRQRLGNRSEIADSYDNIGTVYRGMRDFDKSLAYYEKSVVLRKEIGNLSNYANSLNNIAGLYLRQYRYDKSLNFYLQALEIRKETGKQEDVASSYNNISLLYKELASYTKAIEYALQSLQLYRSSGLKKNEAYALNTLGNIYLEKKDYEVALSYYKKSLEIRKKIGDQREVAATLMNIGITHKMQNQFVDALDEYNNAAELYLKIKDTTGYAGILNLIGNLYKEKKEYYTTTSYYVKALNYYEKMGNVSGSAVIAQNLGEAYCLLKRYREAVPFLQRSIAVANTLNDKELLLRGAQLLSQAYYSNKQFQDAYEMFSLYSNTKDSINNTMSIKKFAEAQIRHELLQKQIELDRSEKQNKLMVLEKQRDRILWIGTVAGLAALVLMLFFIYETKIKSNRKLSEKNKELEETNHLLHISETQLQETNKAKDRFISILAHDLKNPFSSLIGMTRLLSEKFYEFDDEKKARIIRNTNISAIKTYNLLENLLEWSRAETIGVTINPKIIKVAEIVQENIDLYRSNIESKTITIQNKLDDYVTVYADNNMVKTIIRNLLSNAIKFTGDGGSIIIQATSSAQFQNILITDSGIGIAQEDISKLFDEKGLSTFIGNSVEKGTGLGLLLCKEFVTKNNGTISVTSELGKGTTFIISLPKSAVYAAEIIHSEKN